MIVAALERTRMEVGEYSHGFYHKPPQDVKRLYNDMGDRRQIDQ